MQSMLKKVIWACLLVVPFVALYVASGHSLDIINTGTSGFFFPFISGKNFLFRFLIEIAFFSWVALMLKNPEYRLRIKESPILIAYSVFMLILLIADIFGINPEKSFWSNFERMEGYVAHIHLFAYFVVLSAMLHTLSDYSRMFKAFIISNIAVLVFAYGQFIGAKGYIFSKLLPSVSAKFSSWFPVHMSENRLDATLGNSAYFAIYCLTFAFILGLVWLQDRGSKWTKVYPVLIALNLIALFYSGTRGTQIGLLVGGFITLGLMAWFEKGRVRNYVAGIFVITALLVGSVFLFKESAFIQSSPTLSRFASISPNDLTGMSRLSIWAISYEAWKERPLLGYGQENFIHIYGTKFNPEKMWMLESWYDRSHDVFFDWLVAAGLLGLLAYLSLYVVALYVIWIRKNDMPLNERAILTGALAGYFVHNIFVFDNLVSYILFFLLLAYIAFRTGTRGGVHTGKAVSEDRMLSVYLPLIGIVFLAAFYFFVYKPVMVNKLTVKGLDVNRHIQTMQFPDVVKLQKESFEKALALNTLGSEEALEQYLQAVVRMAQITIPADVAPADRARAGEALDMLVTSAKASIDASFKKYKNNIRMLSIYGMFYNGIGDGASAEKYLSLAHQLAPEKQLISFDLVRAYLVQGKMNEAYTLAKETYDLAPQYSDAMRVYFLTAVYAGKVSEARAALALNKQIIPLDSDILSALVQTGQVAQAIELLTEYKKANPEYASQVDAYIKDLLAMPKK